MADFLKKVADGFRTCGVDVENCARVGVAVSGGADSLSLLLSCVEIFGAERVAALTVNHNIRKESETSGDADFVVALCEKIGVECRLFEIPRGRVFEIAEERGGGIEDAARFLRYQAFDSFIEEKNLDWLCLAHNQNDQLETALMRFLQGSGCDGGGGIAFRRGKFIRPLLGIARSEIEDFLNSRKQTWRTDSTNFDTAYLRNRIRNILMKDLDGLFPGWRKSVMNGLEKNACDNETLLKDASDFDKCLLVDSESASISASPISVSIEKKIFYSLDDSIKRRVFQSMLSKIKFYGRFPFKLIREISSWNDEKNHFVRFSSINISLDSDRLKIGFLKDSCTKGESGFFRLSDGFIFRTYQNGDEIRMKDGKMKSVSKIFSDWKVKKEDRNRISIVQDCASLELVALLGGKLGYEDWIVDGFFFSTADN